MAFYVLFFCIIIIIIILCFSVVFDVASKHMYEYKVSRTISAVSYMSVLVVTSLVFLCCVWISLLLPGSRQLVSSFKY